MIDAAETIPLLDLTHLRFQGPDAERYLNGQVTQQVEGLQAGHSRYTFVCDAKGRILFDATIHRDEGGFLLSVQGGNTSKIFVRMDRYLIADNCELSDESDRWDILHQPATGSKAGLVNRFGAPGRDLYQQKTELTEPASAIKSSHLENLRIENGIPRIPDLTGVLPAETGLEESAVSFHKGCYLGQEVISRMKRAGKTNRKLAKVYLSQIPGQLPASFTAVDSEKVLFQATSVATEKTSSGYPALGYLNTRTDSPVGLQSGDGTTILTD